MYIKKNPNAKMKLNSMDINTIHNDQQLITNHDAFSMNIYKKYT